jgi:hypothetical protein
MSRRGLLPIVAIVGVELVVAAVVLATGFVAVSDDDFSRVVIAQRFVAHSSFDPSNSSWLPLPFLLLGSAMSLFGRSLLVARAVAVAESVAALLLVYRAAKNLDLSERAAIASAVLAAVLPTAARLGVSFQPEALTAGLVVFGASTLCRAGRERVFGGLALGAATLCRYEAWPAALVFAVLCAADAARRSRAGTDVPWLASAAALALVPAGAWMLHGALAHGSPFFFFERVSSYRRALGESEPNLEALFAYPIALFREPELLFGVALLRTMVSRTDRSRLPYFARIAALPAAIFLFLVAGRLVGGAPTHHDERPLLPIFWFLAMFVAWCLFASPRLTPLFNVQRTAALVLSVMVFGLLLRFIRTPQAFAARAAELAIGDEAKRRLGADDRMLVETGDYGFFAVIAAFGAPERAEPFDRHDPRDSPAADAFASPAALRSRLAERGAAWFVSPRGERLTVVNEVATPAAQNDAYVLFRTRSALP